MALYEFKKNEIIKNTLIVNPKISFKINGNSIYINNMVTSINAKDGYATIGIINEIACEDGAFDFTCVDASAYITVI